MNVEDWEEVCKVESKEEDGKTSHDSRITVTQVDDNNPDGRNSDIVSQTVDTKLNQVPTETGTDEDPVVVKMEFVNDSVSIWQDDPSHPIEIDLTESSFEPVSMNGSRPEATTGETFASAVDVPKSPVRPDPSPVAPFLPVEPGESCIRPVLSQSPVRVSESPVDLNGFNITPSVPKRSQILNSTAQAVPVQTVSPVSSADGKQASFGDSPSKPLVMLNKLPVNFKFKGTAYSKTHSPSKETIKKSLAKLGEAMSDAGLVTSVREITQQNEPNKGLKRGLEDNAEIPPIKKERKHGRPRKYFINGGDGSSVNLKPYWSKVSIPCSSSEENNTASSAIVTTQPQQTTNTESYSVVQSKYVTVGFKGSSLETGKRGKGVGRGRWKRPVKLADGAGSDAGFYGTSTETGKNMSKIIKKGKGVGRGRWKRPVKLIVDEDGAGSDTGFKGSCTETGKNMNEITKKGKGVGRGRWKRPGKSAVEDNASSKTDLKGSSIETATNVSTITKKGKGVGRGRWKRPVIQIVEESSDNEKHSNDESTSDKRLVMNSSPKNSTKDSAETEDCMDIEKTTTNVTGLQGNLKKKRRKRKKKAHLFYKQKISVPKIKKTYAYNHLKRVHDGWHKSSVGCTRSGDDKSSTMIENMPKRRGRQKKLSENALSVLSPKENRNTESGLTNRKENESNNINPDMEKNMVKRPQGRPRKSLQSNTSESSVAEKDIASKTFDPIVKVTAVKRPGRPRKSLPVNGLQNGPTNKNTTAMSDSDGETQDKQRKNSRSEASAEMEEPKGSSDTDIRKVTRKSAGQESLLNNKAAYGKSYKLRHIVGVSRVQEADNNEVATEVPVDHPESDSDETPVQKTKSKMAAKRDWQVVENDMIQVQYRMDSMSVLSEMNRFRKEGKLCDTVLQGIISCESFSEVTEVKCHSCVLAAVSLTCRDMFLNKENAQSSPYVFRFEDTNRTSLMAVLDFIYMGEMNIGKSDLMKVYVLAKKMNVKSLVELLNQIQESLGLEENSREKSGDSQTVHMGKSLQSTFFL